MPLPGSFGSHCQVQTQLLSFSIQLKVQTTVTFFFPPFFVFECNSPPTLANLNLLTEKGSVSPARLQRVELWISITLTLG